MFQVTYETGNETIHLHVGHHANAALRNHSGGCLRITTRRRLYTHTRSSLLDDAYVDFQSGVGKAVAKQVAEIHDGGTRFCNEHAAIVQHLRNKRRREHDERKISAPF